MEAIVFIAIAAGTLALVTHNWVLLRHETFFQRLCQGVQPGILRKKIHAGSRVWRKRTYLFEANYQRRPLVIRYTFQPGLWNSPARTGKQFTGNELEIEFPLIQKFWLRLLTDYQENYAPEEIVIGIDSLDQHFLIHSNQSEAAKSFLQDEYVSKLLQIFQFLFNKLEIHHGSLRLIYKTPILEQLTHIDLELILETLLRLIFYYESQPGTFKILTVSATGVCPYCREKLNTVLEQIVACNHCNTAVHGNCWLQNGQCTTWGCNSRLANPIPRQP